MTVRYQVYCRIIVNTFIFALLIGGNTFAYGAVSKEVQNDLLTNKQHDKALSVIAQVGPLNEKISQANQFTDCTGCPTMVKLPAGSFRMGDLNDNNQSNEKPVHSVTLPAFAVSKTEITFAQYGRCISVGECNPGKGDEGWGRGSRPVINVNWNDAKRYANWLRKKTNKPYRLLTEAEWEYAARAGSSTKYPWGSQASREYANYGSEQCCDGLAQGRDRWVNTSPAGSFPPNNFGLHDMLGNVWEWVEDCYQDNYDGASPNGRAQTSGNCEYRVMRGGAWDFVPMSLRPAVRLFDRPTSRIDNLGFRVAQDITR